MALQRGLTQDYRAEFAKRPLFKQGLTRITELSEGDVLTGNVANYYFVVYLKNMYIFKTSKD